MKQQAADSIGHAADAGILMQLTVRQQGVVCSSLLAATGVCCQYLFCIFASYNLTYKQIELQETGIDAGNALEFADTNDTGRLSSSLQP